MVWTVFVILLVLSLLGLTSSEMLGGSASFLVLAALAVLAIRLIEGARAVNVTKLR